jgi:hypothetical protein
MSVHIDSNVTDRVYSEWKCQLQTIFDSRGVLLN